MESQMGTTFALDKFSPLQFLSDFSRRRQRAGLTTDIGVDTSGERSAPGVDSTGHQIWDEQPTVLRGQTLELRTRAGGGHTVA
jgi:hypothetical protein